MTGPLKVTLEGVPETTLWTLALRAQEARRPDTELHDPRAVALVDSIDFPFAERFGRDPSGLMSQFVARRAMRFDAVVREVLASDPAAVVVALGEGLETQFWRVDNGRVRWLSVDLPETAAVRARLLGEEPPRRLLLAGSALDEEWYAAADHLRAGSGRVVVVAQGLLMYLPPAGVRRLLVRCAERFRRGVVVFDTVPRWFSQATLRGAMRSPTGYVAPPMPWALDAGRHEPLRALSRHVRKVSEVHLDSGRGFLFGTFEPMARRMPGLRHAALSVVRLDLD